MERIKKLNVLSASPQLKIDVLGLAYDASPPPAAPYNGDPSHVGKHSKTKREGVMAHTLFLNVSFYLFFNFFYYGLFCSGILSLFGGLPDKFQNELSSDAEMFLPVKRCLTITKQQKGFSLQIYIMSTIHSSSWRRHQRCVAPYQLDSLWASLWVLNLSQRLQSPGPLSWHVKGCHRQLQKECSYPWGKWKHLVLARPAHISGRGPHGLAGDACTKENRGYGVGLLLYSYTTQDTTLKKRCSWILQLLARTKKKHPCDIANEWPVFRWNFMPFMLCFRSCWRARLSTAKIDSLHSGSQGEQLNFYNIVFPVIP